MGEGLSRCGGDPKTTGHVELICQASKIVGMTPEVMTALDEYNREQTSYT